MTTHNQPHKDLLQAPVEDLFSELESEINNIKDEVAQENVAFELMLEIEDSLTELEQLSPEDYKLLIEKIKRNG